MAVLLPHHVSTARACIRAIATGIVFKSVRCTGKVQSLPALSAAYVLQHLGITPPTTIVFSFGGTRLALENLSGKGNINCSVAMDAMGREVVRGAGACHLMCWSAQQQACKAGVHTTEVQHLACRCLTSDMRGFSLEHLLGAGGSGQGVCLRLRSAGKDEDGAHVLEARLCRDGHDIALDPVR
jgi:hypothetical protein